MRLLFNILVLSSAVTGPFFVTLALMVFGVLYFSRYVEVVFVAFLVELLYRGGGTGFWSVGGAFFIVACSMFVAAEILRLYVRTRPR